MIRKALYILVALIVSALPACAQLSQTPPGLWSSITTITKASTAGYTSWANQGSATETDGPMGMVFNLPSAMGSHQVNGLYKTAPSTPYTVTALILLGGSPQLGNDANALIGWYDGTNGIDALSINAYYGMISVGHFWYATPTTPQYAPSMNGNCNPANATWLTPLTACTLSVQPVALSTNLLWVQLSNSGTQISVSASLDGMNYTPLYAYPIANGWLGKGYNDLIIGGDPYLGPMQFTVASYVD